LPLSFLAPFFSGALEALRLPKRLLVFVVDSSRSALHRKQNYQLLQFAVGRDKH